jgi:hypothetical protein
MRFSSTGMKTRVLVFFDEGEDIPAIIRYKKLNYTKLMKARMRKSERELYADAYIYER